MPKDDPKFVITDTLFSFDTRKEADDFHNVFVSAFCAIPEADRYAMTSRVIEAEKI